MSSVRKTPRGRYELTIRSKLLPKPVYMTFDDQAEAQQYGHQVDQLLAAGVVPAGLVQQNASAPKPTERLRFVLIAWLNTGQPAATDIPVLDLLVAELGKVLIADLTYKWSEAWVRSLKLERNFAPGTIRKRVGSLSRCLDDSIPMPWWATRCGCCPRGLPHTPRKTAPILRRSTLRPATRASPRLPRKMSSASAGCCLASWSASSGCWLASGGRTASAR